MRVGQKESEWVQVRVGLRQGCLKTSVLAAHSYSPSRLGSYYCIVNLQSDIHEF